MTEGITFLLFKRIRTFCPDALRKIEAALPELRTAHCCSGEDARLRPKAYRVVILCHEIPLKNNDSRGAEKIIADEDLSRVEAEAAMEQILSGNARRAIAGLLTTLRMKGETVDELVGFATAMRRHATPIFPPGSVRPDEVLVDTCGTGGDGSGTFNVSTAAAFVVAGAGVRVAKHGNRSISSRCGSADVLEQPGNEARSNAGTHGAPSMKSASVFFSRRPCTRR